MKERTPPRPSNKQQQSSSYPYQWAACAMNSVDTYLVTPSGDLLVSRCSSSAVMTGDEAYQTTNRDQEDEGDGQRLMMNLSLDEKCKLEEVSVAPCLSEETLWKHNHALASDGSDNCRNDINSNGNGKNKYLGQHDNLIIHRPDEALDSIPSFDYSHGFHIHEEGVTMTGNNDGGAVEGRQAGEGSSGKNGCLNILQNDMFGIPTFYSSLSQIRVVKVSAHPLGSHCLLISSEALLFSFGSSNEHGQIGNGTRKVCAVPTILTPILENGGKAIDCAAGAYHSLVVVKTDGKRVKKYLRRKKSPMSVFSRTSDDKFDENDTAVKSTTSCNFSSSPKYEPTVCLHQVYAFGSNNNMKLGLVNSSVNESEDVLLPRRVALHVRVVDQPGSKPGVKYGIFSIAASVNHSAAIVRRSNGSTELYTWGYARDHALGHDTNAKIVVSPSLVRTLPSYLNSISCRKNISNDAAINTLISSTLSKPLSQSENSSPVYKSEVLVDVKLGIRCTFVLTSTGRILSFGTSDIGLLGLGSGVTKASKPEEIKLNTRNDEEVKITALSVGLHHAVATCKDDGSIWKWGSCENGRLGPMENSGEESASVTIWTPTRFHINSDYDNHAVLACAGFDATILVMSSGNVLSCGKNSGRLGQGNDLEADTNESVEKPIPMFGGMKLWHDSTITY